MSTALLVRAAAEEIAAACDTVPAVALRVKTDPGAQPATYPAVIVGPPALTFEGYGRPPTGATFLVYVIERVSAGALESLWDLVPEVCAAIDEHSAGAVQRADPGVYAVGGTDMPCYEITVDIGL